VVVLTTDIDHARRARARIPASVGSMVTDRADAEVEDTSSVVGVPSTHRDRSTPGE